MPQVRTGVVFVKRHDHDKWITDKNEIVRVLGCEDFAPIAHGAIYSLWVDETRGCARILWSERTPWTDKLRARIFGASLAPLMSVQSFLDNPAIIPSKKTTARQWMQHDELRFRWRTGGQIPGFDVLAAARDGAISSSTAFEITRDPSHLAVCVAFWVEELTDAMKRHCTVWISAHLTKNCTHLEDETGIQDLVSSGRVVRCGARLAFAWAADKRAAFLIGEDDCDARPTTDLGVARGDRCARVDEFVNSKVVCNTMLRDDVAWGPVKPFEPSPETIERVPRFRLAIWLDQAENEGALILGDAVGCTVTYFADAPDPQPLRVRSTMFKQQSALIVNDSPQHLPLTAAIQKLKTITLRSYEDVFRLPKTMRFAKVYAVQDAGTHPGWIREMHRFGPLCVLRVSG